MAVFKTWLKAEHDKRGWDQRTAAKAYGVVETNVSNWLSGTSHPSAMNLIRISLGLKTPIANVMRAAGYDLPLAAGGVDDSENRRDERAAVLASLPQFAEILDLIARQPAEQQAVYVALIKDQILRLIPRQGTSPKSN